MSRTPASTANAQKAATTSLLGTDADGTVAPGWVTAHLALAAAGLSCRPHGALVAIDPIAGEGVDPALAHDRLRDLVRDTAADLGVGLVRIQPQRGHLEDVFREEVAS